MPLVNVSLDTVVASDQAWSRPSDIFTSEEDLGPTHEERLHYEALIAAAAEPEEAPQIPTQLPLEVKEAVFSRSDA